MFDSEITRKQVAYDLTMEYLRQENALRSTFQDIYKRTDFANEVYKAFYNSLECKEIIDR
mgnify:CR=1 FL=1|nr:MAG TPA: hypothetical protein [Caudoviricetes sp.]